MRRASERLAALGLTLPAVPTPVAAYLPATRFDDLVFTSGQLPTVDGALVATGRVGAEVSPEEAYACARTAALNGLAAVADHTGDLDVITRVIKVVVYVASAPGFTGQPQVANGASQLLFECSVRPAGTPVVRSAWRACRWTRRWRWSWSSRSARCRSSVRHSRRR